MSYAPAATSYCRTTSGVNVSRGEPVVPAKPEIRYINPQESIRGEASRVLAGNREGPIAGV